MRFVAAIETWCANVVERTFARAFPGALEPAQIARRLIATIEHAPPSLDDEGATGYIVRLSANDAAALETERELLERQWTRMAQALCARIVSAAPAPTVQIRADPRLPNGSIVIDTVVADVTAGQLCLRVERGIANASA
ncbi:MAG: DUF3662 domain-containing protein, partial [Candidatus Eremiobacteraeota bacterium]|nr:DUF3662 domain-containing protein [Candidatus Eremiobacteraeota bacterium]